LGGEKKTRLNQGRGFDRTSGVNEDDKIALK